MRIVIGNLKALRWLHSMGSIISGGREPLLPECSPSKGCQGQNVLNELAAHERWPLLHLSPCCSDVSPGQQAVALLSTAWSTVSHHRSLNEWTVGYKGGIYQHFWISWSWWKAYAKITEIICEVTDITGQWSPCPQWKKGPWGKWRRL